RGRLDDLGALHLHAEVVHAGVVTGLALQQHELQRRLRDGEVGVARAPFGRGRAEQGGVELDGALEIGHTQGELDSGHEGFLSGATNAPWYRRPSMWKSATNIDGRQYVRAFS